MNQKEFEINGKKIILTERPAADVQDVFDFYDRIENENKKGFKLSVQVAVWMVFQSLRSTRRNIPLWLFWKKLSYLKFSIKYLAKKVAPHILFKCQDIILELDELNKKKEEAGEKGSPGLNAIS